MEAYAAPSISDEAFVELLVADSENPGRPHAPMPPRHRPAPPGFPRGPGRRPGRSPRQLEEARERPAGPGPDRGQADRLLERRRRRAPERPGGHRARRERTAGPAAHLDAAADPGGSAGRLAQGGVPELPNREGRRARPARREAGRGAPR